MKTALPFAVSIGLAIAPADLLARDEFVKPDPLEQPSSASPRTMSKAEGTVPEGSFKLLLLVAAAFAGLAVARTLD